MSGFAVDPAMIADAARRLDGRALRTPLLESALLNEAAGRRILIKAECLQHGGAFKFRGAWSAMTALAPERLRAGVIAYSSGNHAQGVALAARLLGVPAVIVMPEDAPRAKRDATRALGAELATYRRGEESREELAARIARARGLTLVRPYDDPHVIAGQGTAGLEIAAQARAAGVARAEVLVPCGGGGLTAGVALALAEAAPDMRVRPVEPEGFDDVARSLAAGRRLSNPSEKGSICDAILTPCPGELTFPIMRALCGPGLRVRDDEALRAMATAFERLRIVVEPGGAAALAAALFRPDSLESDAAIVIASGGNVDSALFARALTRNDGAEV